MKRQQPILERMHYLKVQAIHTIFLSEAPSYYKEATVNSDGSLSFGEIKGTKVQTLSDATTKFSTSSRYGDYQLNISGLPSEIKTVYV